MSQLEPQVGEVVEERRLEQRLAVVALERRQVGEIRGVEAEVFEVLDGGCQPAGDGEAAVEGVFAEEEVEDGLAVADPGFQ